MSHVDSDGNTRMVNVGHKPDQIRIAMVSGHIKLSKNTLRLVADNKIKKGDVLTVAKIAGIQAAKNTPQLIPLCHTLLTNSKKTQTPNSQLTIFNLFFIRVQRIFSVNKDFPYIPAPHISVWLQQ